MKKSDIGSKQAAFKDPSGPEMHNYLKTTFGHYYAPNELESKGMDIAHASYWYANHYHGGKSSNLYSHLSTTPYNPGMMEKGPEEEGIGHEMYEALKEKFGKSETMNKSINLDPKAPKVDEGKDKDKKAAAPKPGLNPKPPIGPSGVLAGAKPKKVIGPSDIKATTPPPGGVNPKVRIAARSMLASYVGSKLRMSMTELKDAFKKAIMEELMEKAYGDKRDHPKIELFHNGEYKATTTWAPTLKAAKEMFIKKNPELDASKVTASFKETKKSEAVMKKAITVDDLADTGQSDHPAHGASLHCPDCDTHYSATKGDYFNMPEGKAFTCNECGGNMVLARQSKSTKIIKKSLFTEEDLIGKPDGLKKSTIDTDASKLYKKNYDEPVAKSDLYAGSGVDEMFKGWFVRQPEEMDTTARGSKIAGYARSGKPRLLSSFVNRAPQVSAKAHETSQSAYGMGGQYRGVDAHHDAMKAHLSAAFHQHLAGDSSTAHDHMDMAKEHLDHIGEDKVRGKAKWQERFDDTAQYVGWPKKKDE